MTEANPAGIHSAGGRLELERVTIRFDHDGLPFVAVNNVSFTVNAGEFLCLLGPSGCGKSTLLSALVGHLQPSSGALRLDGQAFFGPHPERGLVFQQPTLFPWRRVVDNVGFGLKMQGVAKAERRAIARNWLALMGLAEFTGHYPSQLSGGMQQRVEIARVLANQPKVMLMDEPFAALDAQTRMRMQQLLLNIWDQVPTTIVFVTHDIDEAIFLADRILVMSPAPGRIVADLPVNFRRPRDSSLLTAPAFSELKRRCLDLLHPDAAADGYRVRDAINRSSTVG